MKKATSLLFVIFLVVFYNNNFVYTYSGKPPVGHTGAPDQETCAHSGCHSSNSENTYTPFLRIGDATTEMIQAGQIYDVSVGFASPVDALPPRSGFQMLAFDEKNESVGSFVTDGTSTDVTTSADIEYAHHKNAKEQDGNMGTYQFQWMAPETLPASVTFYAAALASNANNTTTGDEIYTMSLTLNSEITDIDEATPLASSLSLSVFLAQENKTLFVKYSVPNTDFLAFNLFDLKGQLIKSWSQNQHQAGDFTQTLELNNLVQKGMYILQIKTDNAIANQKFLAF